MLWRKFTPTRAMKTSYLLLVLLVSAKALSQCPVYGPNLIPNPSFELTNAFCTGTDNQLYVDQSPVQNWIGTDPLSSGGSTPDITRNDATVCGSIVNAANNTCFTGTKKLGLFVYTSSSGREYIQAQLTSNLVAGRTYCFSMDVRSRYGAAGNVLLNTDGIGAHFRNSGAINIQTMNGGNQFLSGINHQRYTTSAAACRNCHYKCMHHRYRNICSCGWRIKNRHRQFQKQCFHYLKRSGIFSVYVR